MPTDQQEIGDIEKKVMDMTRDNHGGGDAEEPQIATVFRRLNDLTSLTDGLATALEDLEARVNGSRAKEATEGEHKPEGEGYIPLLHFWINRNEALLTQALDSVRQLNNTL